MWALTEKRSDTSSGRDDQASQETALKLAQERVKGLEANYLEVEEAETHMEALQPQVEQQTEWEAALKSALEQVRLLDRTETQLSERQGQLSDLRGRLENVEAGLDTTGRDARFPDWPQVRTGDSNGRNQPADGAKPNAGDHGSP